MKTFYIMREDLLQADVIAEGAEFSDGSVVLHWLFYPYSISLYHNFNELMQEVKCDYIIFRD